MEPDKRPERAVTNAMPRCKGLIKIPRGAIYITVAGHLRRRIAQYDYWAIRYATSVLDDATADILLYGNAERHHS